MPRGRLAPGATGMTAVLLVIAAVQLAAMLHLL
jgi:hypothetical protein